MQTTQLYVIRHGETFWNIAGRIQGTLESGLTDIGIAQANALSANLLKLPFQTIYSSDLSRAYQTAKYIADPKGLEVVIDSGLQERNFGIFQGLTWRELEVKYPEELQQYRTNPEFIVPNGESTHQFYDRCAAIFNELAVRHLGQRILIVTHGGVVSNLLRYALGIPFGAPRRFEVVNTSVNIFMYKENHWMLERWGDVHHLQHLQSLDDNI
ncbi:fructose-2,6-bisphosphatase [Beggiatoa alba B18LD]|uniref:Fructose-2,6-bisphosphatase n=1 Tax=Beggiatoa alba B18LD TaxID=395493 RepID=I3CJJ1_9GAMM|nr:histidine phosphatase family protein [Beggiatoa alba]EIJ43784.1 fructose-2,6-bisphosphatase [Beggiatoa alba B18LD]